MIKELLTMVAVTGAVAVAGCGSSSSSSSAPASSSSAPASSSSAAAPSSTSTAAASSSSAAGAVKPALAQAVTACKAAIASQATIPAAFKSKLDHICDIAGTGDQGAVKKATHDVCVEIIKERLPSSEQSAALASCPAA